MTGESSPSLFELKWLSLQKIHLLLFLATTEINSIDQSGVLQFVAVTLPSPR